MMSLYSRENDDLVMIVHCVLCMNADESGPGSDIQVCEIGSSPYNYFFLLK